MRVLELMSAPVFSIEPSRPAAEAFEIMKQHQVHHLVVGAGRAFKGVISARDRSAALARGATMTAGDLVQGRPITVAPETTLRRAAALLRGHNIGCLPVVADGRVVGIVTISDLLELLSRGHAPQVSVKDRQGRRHRDREMPFDYFSPH